MKTNIAVVAESLKYEADEYKRGMMKSRRQKKGN